MRCLLIGVKAGNPTKWGDGSNIDYTKWCEAANGYSGEVEPNEGGGSLSLMWDKYYEDGYCWADYGSDDPFRFICEQHTRKYNV